MMIEILFENDPLYLSKFLLMHLGYVPENSWGYLFLLYVFVQLSRVVVVGMLFPFLRYFGYGLDWKEAIILVWSGLRGAVALSLSLSVKAGSASLLYFSFIFPWPGLPLIFIIFFVSFLIRYAA